MKKILVLEGLPALGKSTIANYLSKNHNFRKINESLGKLIGANDTTDQEFIFKETKRKYMQALQSNKNSIIDRGYPSMLAWDYCSQKLGRNNYLDEKTLWVNNALMKNELYEPDYYIYLKGTPTLSLKRRIRVINMNDVWSEPKGMMLCLEFYEKFFSDLAINKKTLFISSRNNLHKIISEILEFVK